MEQWKSSAAPGTAAGRLPTALPKHGCLESGAASSSLHLGRGKQVLKGSAHKARTRRAGGKLQFCFLSGWLRWTQISWVSLQFRGTSLCVPVTYTVRKTWISCKNLEFQVILQIIMIANLTLKTWDSYWGHEKGNNGIHCFRTALVLPTVWGNGSEWADTSPYKCRSSFLSLPPPPEGRWRLPHLSLMLSLDEYL